MQQALGRLARFKGRRAGGRRQRRSPPPFLPLSGSRSKRGARWVGGQGLPTPTAAQPLSGACKAK